MNSDCQLKLADFGLARVFHDSVNVTSVAITDYVTTRWYRAPEILGGWTSYGSAIDMWAFGCILAELYKRSPVFPGQNSQTQLELFVAILGKPESSFIYRCKKIVRK